MQWIHGRGYERTQRDSLNCWEGVFFAAYKAGLMSIPRLRVMHIKATIAGRVGSGFRKTDRAGKNSRNQGRANPFQTREFCLRRLLQYDDNTSSLAHGSFDSK